MKYKPETPERWVRAQAAVLAKDHPDLEKLIARAMRESFKRGFARAIQQQADRRANST